MAGSCFILAQHGRGPGAPSWLGSADIRSGVHFPASRKPSGLRSEDPGLSPRLRIMRVLRWRVHVTRSCSARAAHPTALRAAGPVERPRPTVPRPPPTSPEAQITRHPCRQAAGCWPGGLPSEDRKVIEYTPALLSWTPDSALGPARCMAGIYSRRKDRLLCPLLLCVPFPCLPGGTGGWACPCSPRAA